jgi:DNA-binding transcriptional LysR family regulator
MVGEAALGGHFSVAINRHHLLARKTKIRLTDCLDYPLALPSAPYAVRTLLQEAFDRAGTNIQPAAEAESYVFLRNFADLGDAIAFEIQIGVPGELRDPSLVGIPLDLGRRTEGLLHVAQLHGRTLSVAAASFAQQIIGTLTEQIS